MGEQLLIFAYPGRELPVIFGSFTFLCMYREKTPVVYSVVVVVVVTVLAGEKLA